MMNLFMRSRMCMSGIPCGLMVVMQMNCYSLVQNRDGVHNIVSAASRIVRTQTHREDVRLPFCGVPIMQEQKKYRSVPNVPKPLPIRNANTAALESSNHKQKSKPPVSKPKRLGRLLTRITNTNTTRKTNIHF